jgi:hypothetical protein
LAWIAFYNFCNIIGVPYEDDDNKKLHAWLSLGKSTGWWIAFDGICFCFERPNVLNLDSEGRLHSETASAIGFRDSYSLYSYHGVQVPEYVILNPEKISVDDIEKENNAEVRRVKIVRFGQARYLLESGAKEIHRDNFGILYQKEIKSDEPLVMVKVVNSTPEPDGSFKDYFIRCDPKLRPLPPGYWPEERKREFLNKQKPQSPMTARAAIASTFGLREQEYAPEIET